jgi:hypothetical protein
MLRGQTQVEQWGIVGEVFQDDEPDPSGVGVDPERVMVLITEVTIIDPAVNDGAGGPSGHMEREFVRGQELDELGSIAVAIVESKEGDLHVAAASVGVRFSTAAR